MTALLTNTVTAAFLALATGAASYTMTKAKISAPLRVWLVSRKAKIFTWVTDLMMCPYCFGHWVAFAAAIIWRPWLVPRPWDVPVAGSLAQFVVTSLALVAGSSAVVIVISKAIKG